MVKSFKIRLVAGIMTAIMLFLLVPGCGGSNKGKQGGDASGIESTAKPEGPKAEETPAPTPEEAVDLGGYEFILGSHWGKGYFPEVGVSEYGDKMLKRYSEIEEKYNCKITYKDGAPDVFVNDVNSAAASGVKYADVIEANLWWFQGFYEAGYLEPLNDIKNLDFDNTKWADVYKRSTLRDGKVYGVNFTSWYQRMPHYFYITYFNKNLLKKYSQPSPYDLIKEGKWTWEAFRDIAKACTRDENGDGNFDFFGVTSLDRMFEYTAMWSNGARDVAKGEDGKYKFGYADDKAYKALQFVRDIINIDKSFANLHDPRVVSDWKLPAMEFVKGNMAFFVYHTEAVEWPGWLQDMEDDFGVVPFPLGPDGKKWGTATTGDLRVFCIPKTATDKDKAAFIFNKITAPFEGTTADEWKDYAKRTYFRDEEGFKYYLEGIDTAEYDFGAELQPPVYMLPVGPIMAVTRDNASTPAEAMQGIKDRINAVVDEKLNK